MKIKFAKKLAGLMIAFTGLTFLLASVSNAEKQWNAKQKQWRKDHPRRVQVNNRMGNQNKRINQGEKSGKLTEQQAQQLHQEDQQIRQEERAMAKENGGHITKAEQKALNQQENAVSKQIYKEKHSGQ